LQLAIITAAAVFLRAWRITGPFVWPFDTAFQESLALSHLDYGLAVTHGIAGFGFFHGKFLYHAAHPPILQLLYAVLYELLGKAEWVSRSVSILAALGTAICLWMTLVKIGARRAAFAAALFFAVMPLSVELGRTTNYEPGGLFLISLFILGYTLLPRRSGIALMSAVAFIGGFFEWTVYLAIPAVALGAFIENRSIKNLKFIVAPALFAGAALAIVLVWQKTVVGLIPMFGHAAVRSNPRALFDIKAWSALFSHPIHEVGWGWLVVAIGLLHLKALSRTSPKISGVLAAYLAVPALFLLLAPQLVLSHPIAALYTVPIICIFLSLGVESTARNWVWAMLALLLIFYLWSDSRLIGKRSDFFYNLARITAEKIGSQKSCKVYDSAAVGYLRYYNGIETFHPVGAGEPPVEEFIKDEDICAFMVDVSHPEVAYVAGAVRRAGSELKLVWRLHGVEVWFRGADDGTIHLTNMLDEAKLPPISKQFWENPTAEIMEIDGRLRFGILHHSRSYGASAILFKDIPVLPGTRFKTSARLDTDACNRMVTDGVSYSIKIYSADWSKYINGEIVPIDGKCDPVSVEIPIEGNSGKVNVELDVSPLLYTAFDRFFWDDPRLTPAGRE